ncbi:hypothetical protein [Haloferax sp. DFSO60]|uniref:hypothetical protein n=1 Tax=Haloferax sp. DFSO60 TaxID=3388652 RepID=UPI003979315C
MGVGIQNRYGSEWFSLLNVAVSAALSSALVLLYFRQSAILESQKELLKAEMNRGIREQHTETLRERVRKWHGNPDREISDDPINQPSKNLPFVGTVSFSSAPSPNEISYAFEEDEFRVIPQYLENDRYMRDLLENHAPDLKKQAERVVSLKEQFDTHQQKFLTEFNYEHEGQYNEFALEPQDHLSLWLFEHLVRLERGFTDDFAELRERMVSEVTDTTHHPDEPIVWVLAKATNVDRRAVYGARYDESESVEWNESRSELVGEVEKIVRSIVDNVEADYPFDPVTQAADTLNQGAVAVDELEQILIEYDGKPIYQGGCKYLDEAEVGD